eukprot:s1315_g5.t1
MADGDELQKALDIFSEMLSENAIVMVNDGLVQEVDRRVLLDCRINAVLLADPALSAAECGSSVDNASFSAGHRDSAVPEDMPTTSDEIALIELRKALADAAMDEDQLERAIDNFVNSSKVVRQSMAGRELLEKARNLQELWRWWRACADAKEELRAVLDFMLEQEARYQDAKGEFNDFGIQDPPYDLGPLAVQLENSEAYRSEMAIMIEEGTMVWERLHQSNLRFAAEKRIRAAMKDEREDDLSLDEALSAGEACGVRSEVIHAGREIAANWRANHYKIALHDELFQAVKELRKHVESRKKPGAGAPEQQRMRIAIAGSGLPAENPLVIEAWGLLRQWEQDNVALRAEARLSSAVERVKGGFSADTPEAGDLLGSAIAEVAQQGVDAAFLDAARNSLANWQESRLKRARQDLELAMRYLDEDYLKDSLELARTAGIDEESIEQATRLLTRLRMVDEVNKMMDKTMEETALPPLEAAIQTAHSHFFVEEEMDMLWSGSLQARLRFWTQEIQGAVQVHEAAGLDVVVAKAQKLLERSQARMLPSLRDRAEQQLTAGREGLAVRSSRDKRECQPTSSPGRPMAELWGHARPKGQWKVLLSTGRDSPGKAREIHTGELRELMSARGFQVKTPDVAEASPVRAKVPSPTRPPLETQDTTANFMQAFKEEQVQDHEQEQDQQQEQEQEPFKG